MVDQHEYIRGLLPYLDIVKGTALPSLFLSQGCKESGFGKYEFFNNFMGIKCHKGVKCRIGKTSEVIDGALVPDLKLAFAVYDSREDCAKDYVRILNYKYSNGFDRYAPVRAAQCYQQATYQIQACGYATGLTYGASLRANYIEPYVLYDFDFKKNYKSDITKNFKWYEAFSSVKLPNRRQYQKAIEPPEDYWENISRVAAEAQKLRDYFKAPIGVNSWYRTPEFNSLPSTGGKPNSQHLTGLAVDLHPLFFISIKDFYRKAKEITAFKGFGIGKTFLHCDLREKETLWYY